MLSIALWLNQNTILMIVMMFCHVGSQGRARAVVLELFHTWCMLKALSCLYFRLRSPLALQYHMDCYAHMLKGGKKYKPSDLLEVTFVLHFKWKLFVVTVFLRGVLTGDTTPRVRGLNF